MTITSIYADGGVILANPSAIGGTWAWCFVDEHGRRIRSASGIITPAQAKLPTITNNLTEFLAATLALEVVAGQWRGSLCLDSEITLNRLFKGYALNGIPEWLIKRCADALFYVQMSQITPVLIDGHPTKAQLAFGVGKAGRPVSAHNVYCDKLCSEMAHQFKDVKE